MATGSYEVQNGPLLLSAKPTLPMLTFLPTQSGDGIKIIERIGIKFRTLGILLLADDDGAKTEAIIVSHHHQPADITRGILSSWLNGGGRKPVTWGAFIAVLHQAGLQELAQDIEKQISQGQTYATVSDTSVEHSSPKPQDPKQSADFDAEQSQRELVAANGSGSLHAHKSKFIWRGRSSLWSPKKMSESRNDLPLTSASPDAHNRDSYNGERTQQRNGVDDRNGHIEESSSLESYYTAVSSSPEYSPPLASPEEHEKLKEEVKNLKKTVESNVYRIRKLERHISQSPRKGKARFTVGSEMKRSWQTQGPSPSRKQKTVLSRKLSAVSRKTPLKEKTNASLAVQSPSLLQKKCDQHVLMWLTRQVKHWKFIARWLKLSENEISTIVTDHPQDSREQCYQMFMQWKSMDPDNYNYLVLGEALKKESEELYSKYEKEIERVENTIIVNTPCE